LCELDFYSEVFQEAEGKRKGLACSTWKQKVLCFPQGLENCYIKLQWEGYVEKCEFKLI
jgi:hypothetical protein